MKLQHVIKWKNAGTLACGAVAALFVACGQDAAGTDPTASTDTASAYAALSASVQACTDKKDDCVTAAAADATKLAACDAAAESCMQKTQGAQSDAKRRLRDDAEGCMRKHGCRGDDDAGVDDKTRPDMHECVGRNAPASNECRKDLFDCLDKTGLKQSTAQTDLDQATKDAIVACVQGAHTCFVSEMSSHHRGGAGPGDRGPGDRGPGDRGDHAAAGSAPQSAGRDGGRPGFPGAQAGRESHHDAGGPAAQGDAGRPGIGGNGRGQRDAAGAAAPGRGRRDGAGGAGGN
jgi:hypothetical protein